MKEKIKKCKNCGNPRNHNNALVTLCRKCSFEKQKNRQKLKKSTPLKRTIIKTIGEKKKKRIREEGSEYQHYIKMYKQMVVSGENLCMITGKPIYFEDEEIVCPTCFPHILAKKNYPHMRLMSNNIGFVGMQYHEVFDKCVILLKKEIGLVELEKRIMDGKNVFPDIAKFSKKVLQKENIPL